MREREQQELEERQQWELKEKQMGNQAKPGVVDIHGKQYLTVAYRVNEFRNQHEDKYSLTTEIIQNDDGIVIMKATIKDATRVIATGYAEEVRGSTNINKTSALENCETSAMGRALAAFGYAGTEYASADEVQHAIKQQGGLEMQERYVGYCSIVRDNLESIMVIKGFIDADEFYGAGEAWFELDKEVQKMLWVAPSKGGMFTTEQIKIIKNDLRAAYYDNKPED